MRLIVSVFAAVAVFATFTIAHHDHHRIVWHERPVKEQWGCVTTCQNAHEKNTEFYRTQCAVCMDRIRNTVCLACAAAWRNGMDTDAICSKCRHISDYDSTSEFTDD